MLKVLALFFVYFLTIPVHSYADNIDSMLVSVDNKTCSADVKVHLYWYCGNFVLAADSITYNVSNDTIFLKVRYAFSWLTAISYPDTLITLSGIPAGDYLLKCNLYVNDYLSNSPWVPVDSMNTSVAIPEKFSFNPLPDQLPICNYNEQDNILLDASVTGVVSYSWFPGGEISSSITINVPGKYIVSAIDTAGCPGVDSVMILENCPTVFFIPSAFTPDGDGINDSFFVEGIEIKNIHMSIFNRWGERIFESDSYGEGWDGTYKGKPAEQGVYVYSVNMELYRGNKLPERKGYVILIR